MNSVEYGPPARQHQINPAWLATRLVDVGAIDLGVAHEAKPGTRLGVTVTVKGERFKFDAIASGLSTLRVDGPIERV